MKKGIFQLKKSIDTISKTKFENFNVKRLSNIHSEMNNLLLKMNKQHKLIVNSLLIKTLAKFDSKSLEILNIYNFLTFEIIDYDFIDDHFEYLIQIEDKLTQRIFTFYARYNQLRELHEKIQKFKLEQSSLKFPPKSLFYNNDKNFIEERLKNLNIYFKKLLQNKIFHQILDYSNFKDFFKKLIWPQIEKSLNEKESSINCFNCFNNIKNENECCNLIEYLKNEEIIKLENKYNNIKEDICALEQNDIIFLMHFDEKSRRDCQKQEIL